MTTYDDKTPREDLSLCAHDLRGILTVIAGYAALLRRDDISASDRASALDGIDSAIARADSLLCDTLSGRRPSLGGETVDLSGLVRQAAADTKAADGRDVAVQVDEALTIPGDSVALARVLQNLVGNAVKYAPAGEITVRLYRHGNQAFLEVGDHGPGIPAEQRDAVFEPFARLERDETLPGSGLGLAVVRGVIERHRGRIEVLDREGGGTVMRIRLPLV